MMEDEMKFAEHKCAELDHARKMSADLGGFTAGIESPIMDEKGRVILGIEEYAVVVFYCPFCGNRAVVLRCRL